MMCHFIIHKFVIIFSMATAPKGKRRIEMYYRHTNFCLVKILSFLSLAIASTGLAEEKL